MIKKLLGKIKSKVTEINKTMLHQLHNNNQHQQIIDLIERHSGYMDDAELVGVLARAYNNVGDYEKALSLLLPLKETKSSVWHYRLGFAYLAMGDKEKGQEHLYQAQAFDGNLEEDCMDLLQYYAEIGDLFNLAEQGDARAQYNLGLRYDNGDGVKQDPAQAVVWWTQAAEQGHAQAQYNLGVCYDNGDGVKQDPAQAVVWYTQAAEQGHAQAQYNLGVCYMTGDGVKQDPAQAVVWYTQAAEQGHAQAQCNLGLCYYNGDGVKQDPAQAVVWWTQAAEQGDAQAQCNLGLCYDNGDGVKQDRAQAVVWYTQAAEQGHVEAQGLLSQYGQ